MVPHFDKAIAFVEFGLSWKFLEFFVKPKLTKLSSEERRTLSLGDFEDCD
jgi:hypothetical protein